MLNDSQSVYEALFVVAEKLKQSKCPLVDKWINKMWYVYTISYLSLSNKMEWSTDTYYNMDEFFKNYAKWKNPVITTYCMILFT